MAVLLPCKKHSLRTMWNVRRCRSSHVPGAHSHLFSHASKVSVLRDGVFQITATSAAVAGPASARRLFDERHCPGCGRCHQCVVFGGKVGHKCLCWRCSYYSKRTAGFALPLPATTIAAVALHPGHTKTHRTKQQEVVVVAAAAAAAMRQGQ